MVSQIRIYIEGDPQLRQGFRTFLNPLYEIARNQSIKIEPPKLCGGREAAYKAFKAALKTHSDAFIVLLVDSEGHLDKTPWAHLKNRDNWDSLGTDRKTSRKPLAVFHGDKAVATLVAVKYSRAMNNSNKT